MAAKESVVMLYPEYQVHQNGEWQWVTAPYVGSEANQTTDPWYVPGQQVQVYEVPNSALTRPMRVSGLHSSPAANWLIKVSQGHGTYSDSAAILDGQGHLASGLTLSANSFSYAWCSYAEKTPPPINGVDRIGVLRINSRDF